jgi:hypothetical protein
MSAGLEMMRLVESFNDAEITEKEFDKRAGAAILLWEEEQLREEAVSAGFEVTPDDTMATMIEKIQNDPECQAIDEDPEYKKMIEAEIDAEEAREALIQQMDMEEAQQEEMEVEEETLDAEYEYFEDEDEDLEVKKVNMET